MKEEMKTKIKKITYEKSIFLLRDADTHLIIEFLDDETCNIKSLSYLYYDKTLDKSVSEKIYNDFEKLQLDKWKRSYKPNCIVFDGEMWKLKIEYSDGKIKYRRGENSYPDNYEEFELLIHYIEKEIAKILSNKANH